MSVLRLLRERWPWWVIPLVVMVLLTVLLSWLGEGTTIAPFDYGFDDLPAAPPSPPPT